MKNLTACTNHCRKAIANNKGVILPIVVLLLIVLSLLILVGAKWASLDISRTKDYTKTRQAFYVAETGIEVAMNYLNYSNGIPGGAADSLGFQAMLDVGDGSSWASGGAWPQEIFKDINYNGTDDSDGTFTVTITDNDDGDSTADIDYTVILTSTGWKNGEQSTIEAIVYRGTGSTNHAFITNEELTMSGDYTIGGPVHSNGDATLNGNAGSTVGPVTSSEDCNKNDANDCVEVETTEWIPDINPENYESIANVILMAGNPSQIKHLGWKKWDASANSGIGGQVDATEVIYQLIETTVPTNTTPGDPLTLDPSAKFTCWKPVYADGALSTAEINEPTRCDGSDPTDPDGLAGTPPASGSTMEAQQNWFKDVQDSFGGFSHPGHNKWKVNGTQIPQDSYVYVEYKNPPDPSNPFSAQDGGELEVGGVGTAGTPWSTTIISTGTIKLTGSGFIEKYFKPGLSEEDSVVFFLAGTDIATIGSPDIDSDLTKNALIYARDQVKLGGTVDMKGAVLAKDEQISPTGGNPSDSGAPTPWPDEQGLIDENHVFGNFNLQFDGGFKIPGLGPVQILSWREIEVVS